MEPVQRLIIGNNVYDANDDELEAEVTPYLDNLIQKQKTAKEGKEAIITATQNKTGKVITTNTYAEVVDKISKFEKKTFSVNDLMIRPLIIEPMPTTAQFNQEIIDNKISRFTQYKNIRNTQVVANNIIFSRDIIHTPVTNNMNYKLSIQVNLDFGSPGDKIPLISMTTSPYNDLLFSLCKEGPSETQMYLQGAKNTGSFAKDTKTVIDMSNFNFFAIEIEHRDTMSDLNIFDVRVYGGTRVENKVATSGYVPATKELLFSIQGYNSKIFKEKICSTDWLNVEVGGCSDVLYSTSTFGQTALYLQDFGIRLTDTEQESVVGNTNFLDMEVTS